MSHFFFFSVADWRFWIYLAVTYVAWQPQCSYLSMELVKEQIGVKVVEKQVQEPRKTCWEWKNFRASSTEQQTHRWLKYKVSFFYLNILLKINFFSEKHFPTQNWFPTQKSCRTTLFPPTLFWVNIPYLGPWFFLADLTLLKNVSIGQLKPHLSPENNCQDILENSF